MGVVELIAAAVGKIRPGKINLCDSIAVFNDRLQKRFIGILKAYGKFHNAPPQFYLYFITDI
jgi:hypothetical protein